MRLQQRARVGVLLDQTILVKEKKQGTTARDPSPHPCSDKFARAKGPVPRTNKFSSL